MELLCYFVLLLILGSSTQNELPTVDTTLGKVKGHYKYSYENRIYAAFEGIPYAKPPVGSLRFSEPESAEPWLGIFNATVTHECAQHIKPDLADASEDCLYINVYVPREHPMPHENLDVIVHIHGGAFLLGAPDIAGPEFLMDRDVIYANFNYRLGVFGFLSTEDEVVSGNNGLKDQVLALKWIKSNIEYFGGNPNSVTLVGVSAGGASVHLHYFSNLSKGLFHRGISHSGSALAPWVLYINPLENTRKVAETVGCPQSSTKDMIECLKTKSAKELTLATSSTFKYFSFPLAPFAPVIEKPSKTAFLTKHPYELLEKGDIIDVPWISSVTADEGMVAYFFVPNIKEIANEWYKNAPFILNYFHTAGVNIPNTTKKITEYYFDNSPITPMGIIKAIGDRLFVIPMEEAVEMQAKVTKSSVYSYVYSYVKDMELKGPYSVLPKAAEHGCDALLLYDLSVLPREEKKLSENDEWIKNFLVDAVTSFAKDGIPKRNDIHWEPITNSEDWGYLHIIGKDNVKMEYNNDKKLREFWNSTHCDFWNEEGKIKDEF